VHATEPRSHVENLRTWEGNRRLTGS
jgi:hypothetical protein